MNSSEITGHVIVFKIWKRVQFPGQQSKYNKYFTAFSLKAIEVYTSISKRIYLANIKLSKQRFS